MGTNGLRVGQILVIGDSGVGEWVEVDSELVSGCMVHGVYS